MRILVDRNDDEILLVDVDLSRPAFHSVVAPLHQGEGMPGFVAMKQTVSHVYGISCSE